MGGHTRLPLLLERRTAGMHLDLGHGRKGTKRNSEEIIPTIYQLEGRPGVASAGLERRKAVIVIMTAEPLNRTGQVMWAKGLH